MHALTHNTHHTPHVYGRGGRIVQCPSKNEANKSLATLAVSSFDIPGDTRFPLNAFMTKPSNRGESGESTCILKGAGCTKVEECMVSSCSFTFGLLVNFL